MVLITGTITAISPSFIIGVQAQGDPYHQMYNKYNSYEEQPREYPSQYADREYNSYKPSYEKNSYDTHPSYGNDNYQPREYSSYQQDYKQEYPKYVKENYKPKKDSVSINKFNCINTNLNINGNNTGDINVGNKGAAEGGYVGGYSSDGGSGYNGNAGYYYDNGYDNNKQGKGFECIINNNNNNTNIAAGGGGNVPEPEPEPNCTDAIACFANLNPTQLGDLKDELGLAVDAPDEALCNVLDDFTGAELRFEITEPVVGVTDAVASVIINCLIDAGFTNLIEE